MPEAYSEPYQRSKESFAKIVNAIVKADSKSK